RLADVAHGDRHMIEPADHGRCLRCIPSTASGKDGSPPMPARLSVGCMPTASPAALLLTPLAPVQVTLHRKHVHVADRLLIPALGDSGAGWPSPRVLHTRLS